MSCAVEVRNVSVSYHEHLALRDVSLDIHLRDFVGIIGANGAGKTTLLTVINGLGRIHHGTVSVMDQPATARSFGRLRRRIGYVPQHERIDPRAPVSCLEAVLMGRVGRAGLLRRLRASDNDKARQMMELTRTAHLAARPVGQVSGGEARKIALARALAQEPDILLLDEPTTNLDPPSVQEVLGLVVDAWRRFSLTVVMVTHQLEHLPMVCNRVLMMKKTRIVFAGTREEALTPERLELLFRSDG